MHAGVYNEQTSPHLNISEGKQQCWIVLGISLGHFCARDYILVQICGVRVWSKWIIVGRTKRM